MQVVKNLFLWPSKSYIRKAIEIPLTVVLEALWPKRRIMEVYLNIAEVGPRVYSGSKRPRATISRSLLFDWEKGKPPNWLSHCQIPSGATRVIQGL